MNLHDQVPVVVLHVLEADIPEDAGIVDQNVDSAKGLDGRVDDLFTIFDRIVVGNSLASSCLDLLDYYVCSLIQLVRECFMLCPSDFH